MVQLDAGEVVGDWLVLDPEFGRREGPRRPRLAWCRCTCGVEKPVLIDTLVSERSTRCQTCRLAATRVGAGAIPDPKLRAQWLNRRRELVGRCHNPSHSKFPAYGGRGVVVCAEWRNDPVAFLKWVAAQHRFAEPKVILARLDPAKPYGPANCRVVPPAEHAQRRASCRRVEYAGRVLSAVEFRDRFAPALSVEMVRRYLWHGETPDKIVSRHKLKVAKGPKPVTLENPFSVPVHDHLHALDGGRSTSHRPTSPRTPRGLVPQATRQPDELLAIHGSAVI